MILRAPFFTYDGDVEAALFTLRQFARLWPKSHLDFIIPYTDPAIPARYRKELPSNLRLDFIQTKTSLGEGFPTWIDQILQDTDDDWFFWCSSDRYPIALASETALNRLIAGLPSLAGKSDSVRLARWKDSLGRGSMPPRLFAGLPFQENSLVAHGIWHPQFMSRRHLAWFARVAAQHQPPGMQDFNKALVADLPEQNFTGLYPCAHLIKLEEPTYRGKSTLNLRYRQYLENPKDPSPGPVSPLWISFSSPSAQNRNEYWLKASVNPYRSSPQGAHDGHFRTLVTRALPKLPVVIVTYGGCGSKFVVQQLYPAADKQTLRSAHSHWRVPPVSAPKGQKILYVFGDPRNTIISFFQRRDSLTERHGFGKNKNHSQAPTKPNGLRDWVVRALANLETDSGSLDEHWDLNAYLEHGLDLFRLEEHFDNWAFSQLPYPVVFCRYESLWENWGQLCELLGMAPIPLPQQQARRADWKGLPEKQRGRLNKMYGDFARRLDAYPGLFIADTEGRLIDTAGKPLYLDASFSE